MLAALVLAGIGAVYGKGRLDARHAAEMRDLQRDLDLAKLRITKEADARAADNALAVAQSKVITGLQTEALSIQEYANALEDAGRKCLDGSDTDRLRQLWK